jgi:hypothetical protein
VSKDTIGDMTDPELNPYRSPDSVENDGRGATIRELALILAAVFLLPVGIFLGVAGLAPAFWAIFGD